MEKILIVEDEVIIALDIASKLKSQGYIVIGQVTTPSETLQILETETPDLILMDVNLKADIDGIELAAKIKEEHGIPFIYLTSYSDQGTISRSMATEPYGYIIKPYTEGALFAALSTSFTRIQLEKNIHKQKLMLDNIMNSTTDSIVVLDSDGKIINANKKFNSLFKIKNSVKQNIETITENQINIDYIRSISKSKMSDVLTINTPDSIITILVTTSRLDSSDEDRLLLTITDITEIQSMKEALSEAEGRFTKIFRKKMVPAVLIKCPDMSIFEMNEAFQNLYEVPEDFDTETKTSEIFGTATVSLIKNTLSDNQSFKLDMVQQKTLSGNDFYASFSGKKVNFDKTDFFLIDVNDITDQIKMSEMEKELQQKLIHANKMTSLGTLVSGVAHEINNPNNFIMFNSSLLQDFFNDVFDNLEKYTDQIGEMSLSEFREDTEKLIAGISNGSERIKNIVHDLKGFAKQDKIDLFEMISVENSLNTALRILNHQISKATENFVVDISTPLPKILGNTQKLEQVFINVLMNALESLPGKVSLVIVKCYESYGNIIIEVKDQGVGISEENLLRITDPFFTTKQQDGGTGLGLSIVYSIINEHNGRLDIQSVLGEGTTVTIELPSGEQNAQ